MIGITICRAELDLPAARRLAQVLDGHRARLAEEMEGINVRFSFPHIFDLHDAAVVRVVGRQTFRQVMKRLRLGNDGILEEPYEADSEAYARIYLPHTNDAALRRKVFVQFLGEHRTKPRKLFLDALANVASGQAFDQVRGQISPVQYDVDCVAQQFPDNIWDENFHRRGRIQKGRITGRQVDQDPAAAGLRTGKTLVGIEVPVQNSIEKLRVYQAGSITFMGFSSADMITQAGERRALDKILRVIERLSPCEV